MPDTKEDANPEDQAVFKPSRWPGLIWAVPVAALAIVAWLGISAYLNNGPQVTVVFPLAGGLKAGSTDVEYQGATVGHVSDVTFSKSLTTMSVQLTFISTMAGHLGPGTRFWITGHSLSLTDLSSVKAMISGPFIGIDPHQGKTIHQFTGLPQPPVFREEPNGETLRLVADKAFNVSPGSPILFKGFSVGEVQNVQMEPDGDKFDILAFIHFQYENLLNSSSRFWNAGAVQIATTGASPGLQIQSVPALFLGAIAFETPDDGSGQAVHDGAGFKLYGSESAARAAPGPGAVPYEVIFDGGPHGLAAGAPVQLEGGPAGVVTDVWLQYVPTQAALQTKVILVLQPDKIPLAGQSWDMTNPAPQMNDMLQSLVGQGLRAELATTVPVVGGKMIALDLVTGQPRLHLQLGNPPTIPALGSGGGVGQIMAQVNDILATVNAMPLDQIAGNIHRATNELSSLTSSPRTRRTLRQLDRAIGHVEHISASTDAQFPEILDQVKRSAADAQAALNAAQGMLSGEGSQDDNPESSSLPHALYELTLAAQSLRELTNYLDDHPNALVLGKGN